MTAPFDLPPVKPINPIYANAVINFLSQYHLLTPELISGLHEQLFETKLKKGEYLLRQGEKSTHLYFIIKGMVIGFTTREEKKLTSYICMDGDSVSSISGMYGESPSGESIYLVEDSHFVALSIEALVGWMENSRVMNIIIRKIVESFYRSAHERTNLLRMGSALEKYDYYALTMPHHVDRVPLKYIADYLDIRPNTLAQILKQKDARLNTDLIKGQCELITHYMVQNQSFKQKGLTIAMMAKAVSIPSHQLSKLINLSYKSSFNTFVNNYRIEYVIQKLQHLENWHHLTIEGLGSEAGFSSRSVFFARFKQGTGMTPYTYAKKQALKK